MLEEGVEPPILVELYALSGTMCAWKISIGTSGLDPGVGAVVGETHWLEFSFSGNEVKVWLKCCVGLLVPVCLRSEVIYGSKVMKAVIGHSCGDTGQWCEVRLGRMLWMEYRDMAFEL